MLKLTSLAYPYKPKEAIMRQPNRLNDHPSSETSRRQGNKAYHDTERHNFKTGKMFSSAGGNKKRSSFKRP